MRTLTMACGMACLALVSPGHAEFLLRTTPPPPPGDAVVLPHIALPARRAAPARPVARGFGEDVPLRFAARQIVPENVALVFGDGVDEDAPIYWTGGKAWNRVLADAVRPLGLRVTVTPTRVVIGR